MFQNVITECHTLKIFDPKLPAKITCDASSIGLGATLEQCINVWYPIAFASRTLGKSDRLLPTRKRNIIYSFCMQKISSLNLWTTISTRK